MRIGIIGTGKMGGTLGALLGSVRGHEVFFGSRKRMKSQSLAQITAGAQGGIYEEACEYGQVVILATPWHATEAILQRLAPFLTDTILLDLTNPLNTQMDGLAVEPGTSAGERIQALVPKAQVVKAFNGVPYKVLDSPRFGDHTAEVYYATDTPSAGETVAGLAADLGFRPVSVGELAHARHLEGMVYLWLMQVAAGRLNPANTIFNVVQR